jgi:hypothetical protein
LVVQRERRMQYWEVPALWVGQENVSDVLQLSQTIDVVC